MFKKCLLVFAVLSNLAVSAPKIERFYNHFPFPIYIALGGEWSEIEGFNNDIGNFHKVSWGWFKIEPNYFRDIQIKGVATEYGNKKLEIPSEYIAISINAENRKFYVAPLGKEGSRGKFVIASDGFAFGAKSGHEQEYVTSKYQQGWKEVYVLDFNRKERFQDRNRPTEYHIGGPNSPERRQIEKQIADHKEINKPFGGQFITVHNQTGKTMEFLVGAQLLSLNGAGLTFKDSKIIEHGKYATWQVDSSINKSTDINQKSDQSYFITVTGLVNGSEAGKWGDNSYFSERNKTLSKHWYSLPDGKRYVNYNVTVK